MSMLASQEFVGFAITNPICILRIHYDWSMCMIQDGEFTANHYWNSSLHHCPWHSKSMNAHGSALIISPKFTRYLRRWLCFFAAQKIDGGSPQDAEKAARLQGVA